MDEIYNVSGNRIGSLTQGEAVSLFHSLLHAEATMVGGVDKSKISVPTAINVGDGGVDAEVLEANPGEKTQGVIKQGRTSYQIKTGAFNITNISSARQIIQKDGVREFKPKVLSCLEESGTLVVVLFGSDNPDRVDSASVEWLKQAINEVDTQYANAKLEVWHQNQLVGFLKPFPSLRATLQQVPPNDLLSVDQWSKLKSMKNEMIIGDEQTTLIESIQEAVKNSQNEPLRILGDPGVGKTRTALEALKATDLAPLVIYASKPSAIPPGLLTGFIQADNNDHIILVVDECDVANRQRIWDITSAVSDRVKLVTIYNEQESTLPGTLQINAEPLEESQIMEIFMSEEYGFPEDDARRYAQFCNGSPRVALIIANDVKLSGQVSINSHKDIWERYVRGGEDITADELNKRMSVLKWIALFKRFGYEPPYQNEAELIASKIEQITHITQHDFRVIVADFRNRKILQGDTTLYITPKLLHIWLWSQWWEEHGSSFNLADFTKIPDDKELNEKLMDWFFDMLRYGQESTQVPQIVEDLLSEHGPFGEQSFLDSERGSKLIRILAELDQSATLNFIEKTINNFSFEELKKFRTGRRGIVNALEVLAISPTYFSRSAELLLKLAEAENESWSNNSTGIFKGLFSNGPGAVAPTGATPAQRLPTLKKALSSTSPVIQKIAVEAAKIGLESGHFSRVATYNVNELVGRPKLWKPDTYGELYDAFRNVWKTLVEAIPNLNVENQKDAAKALITSTRGLLLNLSIKDEVVDWMYQLSEMEFTDKAEMIKEIVLIQNYDRKQNGAKISKRLDELKEKIVGTGFDGLLNRYVGMSIIEDEYDEKGDKKNELDSKLDDLARKVVEEPDLLTAHMDWLVSKVPENSYAFGFRLGILDTNLSFFELTLTAMKKAEREQVGVHFLGGYLQSIRRKSEDAWEKSLDIMASDKQLSWFVPEVTWRSGMSDKAMHRVLHLAKLKVVDDDVFGMFSYGSSLEPLSPPVFEETVKYLLKSKIERASSIVLNYAEFYYGMKKKAVIPEDLGLEILTQPDLFTERKDSRRDQMDEYYWHEFASLYIDLYPKRSIEIAIPIIDSFGLDGTISDEYRGDGDKVLIKIAKLYPSEIWNMILPYITPIKDGRGLKLMWWLTGGVSFAPDNEDGGISVFPEDLLWDWVESDVENNAKELARYVPKRLSSDEEGHSSLARTLLVKYGDRQDVVMALNTNNFNEGWSGEASDHYRGKRDSLLKFKETETDVNVIAWIDQYAAILAKYIKSSEAEEERQDW